MEHVIRVWAVVVIVTMIGFAVMGCASFGGGGGGIGLSVGAKEEAPAAEASAQAEAPARGGRGQAQAAPAAGGSDYSAMPALEWPSDETWGSKGLAGITKPEGVENVVGMIAPGRMGMPGTFVVAFLDVDKSVYDNLVSQIRGFDTVTFMAEDTDDDGNPATVFSRQSGMTMGMVSVGYNIADRIAFIVAP